MFGGGGSIHAMQTSLRNNRIFLKKSNRFRERAKKLKTHHIDSHRVRKFTMQEMISFRRGLKHKRSYNNKLYTIIAIVMISILVTCIAAINGLTIF